MNVIYESEAGKRHRYQVEWWQLDEWQASDSQTYRTLLFAKFQVWIWNSLGYKARVIDTRWDSS